MAALLALTVLFVWPPVEPSSASPDSHGIQVAHHGHHPYSKQSDQHRLLHVNLHADCDASAMGCCTMMHCCPGVSVSPHDLPLFGGNGETTAASAVHVTGSDPAMVLPPPRRSPV